MKTEPNLHEVYSLKGKENTQTVMDSGVALIMALTVSRTSEKLEGQRAGCPNVCLSDILINLN